MSESLLKERSLIPLFSLDNRDGAVFDSSQYKRKRNLVLFFLKRPTPRFLITLEETHPEFFKQNAEVVVITCLTVEKIREIHRQHKITVWLLSDIRREVFRKFIKADENDGETAALFMTNKSGELFFQYLAEDESLLPPMDEILKSLVFIESQCREYGGLA